MSRVRPYFFEIFTVVNLVVIQALLWRITRAPFTSLFRILAVFIPGLAVQAAIGIAIRTALARRRYLDAIRSREWLIDTARIVVFSALSVQTYCWIKIAIPLLHPRLFDAQLWRIDELMFGGHSPDIFAVTLFSAPAMLRAIDWSYANVFYASLVVSSVFFASSPDRRIRIAFMDSNIAMWLIGAWLYVLVPALGPAYRFPDVWLPLASMLPNTQGLQHILMTNYTTVLQYRRGIIRPVNILFGIAAFPSLHVGFVTLVFLWMRKLWRYGEIVFGIFGVVILIGSLVTGWHYLIDGIAGALLASLCYFAVVRQYGLFAKRLDAHATADAGTGHAG